LTEPLQEIFSRQDAKIAKKKYFPVSELGVLCVCARVISFPILPANIQPRISNMLG
jgi:hypothetical protein